jgi:type II secretory pathway component PulC
VLTELKLPKQFVVRGISLKNEQTNEQAKTLLEYKGGLFEYVEKDYLLDTDMLLMKIKQKTVNIEYKVKIFTAELDDPNLLAVAEIEEEDFIELLSMTPEQIGARPRIIEHLVNLTATPYIADGMLIQPGLNPELFKSVGFQEDDVLKMINGKSVTLDEEFEMIKKELKTAQTLRFEVMRKGRLITLYLDIPSEALTITGG